MDRVTIKDVAQEAGVSITTVSHVINETRSINPETKARVMDALDKLGYQPNIIARSLRSGKTKTIGLIVPDIANLFFADVARKIEDYGYQYGYSVILGNSDNDPVKQTNYINTLITKQVDGVIFISAGGVIEDLRSFYENGIPVVVADRDVPLELADVVLLDNEKAGYEATRHLLDLGHDCIACITGPNYVSPSMQRVEGYKRALTEFGIPFRSDLIEGGDFQFKSGELAMQRLLAHPCKPTAVFALNDMMAIGALNAAHDAGLSIPTDLSIVGFDNIELSTAVTPALTTVAQPIDEIAQNATNLLIKRMQCTRTEENIRVILSANLIIRNSTSRMVVSK